MQSKPHLHNTETIEWGLPLLCCSWLCVHVSSSQWHIGGDRGQTGWPVVLKGKMRHCPAVVSSGWEACSNQDSPLFTSATEEWEAACGLRRDLPSPILWDPSMGFRGQMRCKSIKRGFVCRFQAHWGCLLCQSGAVNSKCIDFTFTDEKWKTMNWQTKSREKKDNFGRLLKLIALYLNEYN